MLARRAQRDPNWAKRRCLGERNCWSGLSFGQPCWLGKRQVGQSVLPHTAEHRPEGPGKPPLTWLRVRSQVAPLTLRLLQRWPLALSQWQKELCCPSAFPDSEVCMALQVWKTAFTRGLLGREREGRGRRSVNVTWVA